MPPAEGSAAPKVSKMNRSKVYAHTFAGAHAVEGGKLKLTVANRRAGHSLPGGGGGMRVVALTVTFYDAAGNTLSSLPVETYGTEFADDKGATPVPKWLAKRVARQNEIPPDSSKVEWCDIPAKAARAEAVLTYHFIQAAYLPALTQRQVDLSAHQPVVLARATIPVP